MRRVLFTGTAIDILADLDVARRAIDMDTPADPDGTRWARVLTRAGAD